MKLRDRVSMLMSMINSHHVTNTVRRISGKKPLPALQLTGHSANHGPPGRSKDKTFKRNRRATMTCAFKKRMYHLHNG